MTLIKSSKTRIALAAAVLLLTACNGSGEKNSDREVHPPPSIRSVNVIGDSLSDVGAYGVRFTVQAATSAPPYPLWTELVAQKSGTLCSFYQIKKLEAPADFQPTPACGSYAVAGAQIVHAAQDTGLDIIQQMKAVRAQIGTAGFGDHRMLLIDGGGNDVAELLKRFAALAAKQPLSIGDYDAKLLPVLSDTEKQQLQAALAANRPDVATLFPLYLKALANYFIQAIETEIIGAGARYVVIMDIPDITLTPEFSALKAQLPAGFEALTRSGIQLFNRTLKTHFAASPDADKVIVVSAFDQLTAWATSPATYGFTNTSDAVCPPEDTPRLQNIAKCTDGTLQAKGITDWNSYIFSDDFHPTPRGHQLMANATLAAMAAKGWPVVGP